MTDETLIKTIKEVGKQFADLEDEAKKRGYDIRTRRTWTADGKISEATIEVWRKI